MYSTIPQLLFEKAKDHPNAPAQFYKNQSRTFLPLTYMELFQNSLYFAAGLLETGSQPKENIALISDNRKEWLCASIGIMTTGSADIPRGSEATVKDLSYILSFAGCKCAVLENSTAFKKIEECIQELPELKKIIILDNSKPESLLFSQKGIKLFTFDEIIEKGKLFRSERAGFVESLLNDGNENDTATIIFTSGTTGTPKGVELTHKNFLCQTREVGLRLRLKAGDKALSVLPVWHVYEREIEYYLLSAGCAICYSKPILSMIIDDLQKISPQFMACVPRVWDGLARQMQKKLVNGKKSLSFLYALTVKGSKGFYLINNLLLGRTLRFKKTLFIKKAFIWLLYIPLGLLLPFKFLGEKLFFKKIRIFFGGHFKAGMSGGGGLALKTDHFYNSIGIRLLEGYGLTETAPICCMREIKNIVPGTIGRIMDSYCQGKVLNLSDVNKGLAFNELRECQPGEKGLLFIKGENVMKGYYRQPELTEKYITDGWFNTGDIVVKTIKGQIIVKGRSKDTIVLRSGENVEPFPIECKLAESPYIAQAVVLGQDKNSLGVLIIPNREALMNYTKENFPEDRTVIPLNDFSAIQSSEKIRSLYFSEIERLITTKNGFKPYEKIAYLSLLEKPFEVGKELSAKQDLVRWKIREIYKKEIEEMFRE